MQLSYFVFMWIRSTVLDHFLSVWKTSFSFSCELSLLETYSFNFCLFGMSLFYLHFYKIGVLEFFFFEYVILLLFGLYSIWWKISFSFYWNSFVSDYLFYSCWSQDFLLVFGSHHFYHDISVNLFVFIQHWTLTQEIG